MLLQTVLVVATVVVCAAPATTAAATAPVTVVAVPTTNAAAPVAVTERTFVPHGWARVRPYALAPFYVPEAVLDLILLPVQRFVTFAEETDLPQRVSDTLTNEDGTARAVPIIAYKSSDGVGGSVALTHSDLFGRGYDVSLNASGWESRDASASVGFSLPSGWTLLPKHRFVASVRHNENARFRGFLVTKDPPKALFRETELRSQLRLSWRWLPFGALSLHLRGGYLVTRASNGVWDGTTPPIAEVIDLRELNGFGKWLHFFEWETRLVHDTRDHAGFPSRGGQQVVALTRREALQDDGFGSTLYEAKWSQHLALGAPYRVLAFGGTFAAIEGHGLKTPFQHILTLGQSSPLRGFSQDRFRARRVWTMTVEYRYAIQRRADMFERTLYAAIFADFGQAFDDVDDLDFDRVEYGAGPALILAARSTLFLNINVGWSREGIKPYFAASWPL